MRHQRPYEAGRKLRRPDATRRVVAKRFGLSEADAARLTGETLDQVVQSAAALASKRRAPEPTVIHEGGTHVSDQYDRGGVEVDGITSARDLLHDALSNRNRRDVDTTRFIDKVVSNTVSKRERTPEPELPAPAANDDHDDDERRRRLSIEYRLGDVLGTSYSRQQRIDRLERELNEPPTNGDPAA